MIKTLVSWTLKNIQHDFDVMPGEEGVTIRLGTRHIESVNPDYVLELWECPQAHSGPCNDDIGCKYRGIARSKAAWVGNLSEVPHYLLEMEHEPEARTRAGLRRSLVRAYGEEVISKDPIVTALRYERIVRL